MPVQVLQALRAQARSSGSPADYSVPAGINRLLRVVIHWELTGEATLPSLTYGGQAMTLLVSEVAVGVSAGDGVSRAENGTSVFYLKEAGLQAATSSSFSLAWSGATPVSQTDEVSAYQYVYQADPIASYSADSTNDGTNPLTTTVTAVADGYVIASYQFNHASNYTWNVEWVELYDAQAASHTSSAAYYADPFVTGETITVSATRGTTSQTILRNIVVGMVLRSAAVEAGNIYVIGRKMRELFLPRGVSGYIPFELRSKADPTVTISGETVAYKTARAMDGSNESAWTFLNSATEFGGSGGMYRQPITDGEADHDRGFLIVQTTNAVEEALVINFTLPTVQDLRPEFGVLLSGQLQTVTDQTNVIPNSGPSVDDVFNGDRIIFYDQNWNPVRKGRIKDYAGATTRNITLYSGSGQTLTTNHYFKIFDSTLAAAALIDDLSALGTVVTGSSTTSFTATVTDIYGATLTDSNTPDATFKNKAMIVISTQGGSATGKRDIAEITNAVWDAGNSRWTLTLKGTNPLLGIPVSGDTFLITPL